MGSLKVLFSIPRSEFRRKYFDGATLRFIVVLKDEDAATLQKSIEIFKSNSYNPIIFILKSETGSYRPVYKPTLASHFETLDLEQRESRELFLSEGLKVKLNNNNNKSGKFIL